MAEWYYRLKGEEHGPLNGASLKQLADAGTIEPATHVRKGNDGKWVTAEHVKGLFTSEAGNNVPSVHEPVDATVDPSASAGKSGVGGPLPRPAALIQCSDCGSEVSRRAATCPRCGAPVVVEKSYDLRAIAKSQRALILAMLVQVFAYAFFLTILEIAVVLMLVAIVIQLVFVFRLAIDVFGSVGGIFLGILTLIPCVGLIILLVINGQATLILTSHGIKVGLMGADMSKL